MLAIGFDLAQTHQQVVPVLGEPQGGFPAGVGFAYSLHFHGVKLAVARGDSVLAGHAELVLLYLVAIQHQIAHLGLAGHQIALQGQLVGGLVQQARLGRQGELFLLVHAPYFAIGPVKLLGGFPAAAQALALVAVGEGDNLFAFEAQGAFLGQSGDEHAGVKVQRPGAIGVLSQAVHGFTIDRDVLHVRRVAGGKGLERLGQGQAAAQAQYRSHQPAARSAAQ